MHDFFLFNMFCMWKFWPHFSGVSTGRVQIAFIKDEGRHDLKSERYTVAKTSSRFCCEKWGAWGELSPCHSAWKVVGCCYGVVGWWFPLPSPEIHVEENIIGKKQRLVVTRLRRRPHDRFLSIPIFPVQKKCDTCEFSCMLLGRTSQFMLRCSSKLHEGKPRDQHPLTHTIHEWYVSPHLP